MLIKNSKWRNLSLLILVMTVIVLVFEIIPRGIGVVEMVFELVANNNKIDRAAEIEIELSSLNTENLMLKKEIESVVTDYDDSRQISGILANLQEIADNSECDITAIKPGKLEKNKNLWVQNMQLEINGSYENLYNFFRFLENSTKVMIINNATFAPSKTKSRKLEMSLLLEVYLNL